MSATFPSIFQVIVGDPTVKVTVLHPTPFETETVPDVIEVPAK